MRLFGLVRQELYQTVPLVMANRAEANADGETVKLRPCQKFVCEAQSRCFGKHKRIEVSRNGCKSLGETPAARGATTRRVISRLKETGDMTKSAEEMVSVNIMNY